MSALQVAEFSLDELERNARPVDVAGEPAADLQQLVDAIAEKRSTALRLVVDRGGWAGAVIDGFAQPVALDQRRHADSEDLGDLDELGGLPLGVAPVAPAQRPLVQPYSLSQLNATHPPDGHDGSNVACQVTAWDLTHAGNSTALNEGSVPA